MAEIDPVILQLRADVNSYLSTLRSTTSKVDALLGTQEKRARQLEQEMKRSSGAISGHLRGLAGTLATYFTGREVVGLLDNFTKLQNSLRVAGLEGNGLASVQARLLGLSSKYGVSINELANLYGKAAQTSKELGASDAQLLQITEASAQALRITGTSSTQAQGALLGLTQALSSGRVKAEEFNQINEGGLRPLLQVAANTEKYGGSVAKLRQAVVDGKVSSQEFYQAILKGSAELEGKANLAALTLAGSFEALTSALTVYVGGAASANGVTGALAVGIKALADNLDTVIPALTIISIALGGRFLAGALAGGTALRTLAAYASIATTSLAGTALAARGAGAALLGAFGGPVGLAITAIGAALYYVSTRTSEVEAAQERLQSATNAVNESYSQAISLSNKYFNAAGKEREAIKALILSKLELAKANGLAAKSSLAENVRDLNARQRHIANRRARGANEADLAADHRGVIDAAKRVTDAVEAVQTSRDATSGLQGILQGRPVSQPGGSPVPIDDGKKKKAKKEPKGPTGPTVAEIANRFDTELTGVTQQILSARQSMAKSAEERAELELRSVELAKIRTLADININDQFNAAQKARLREHVEELAIVEKERIELEKRAQLEQDAQQLRDEKYRAEAEDLRIQFDMADTQKERKRLALAMLFLEQRYQESLLQAIIASETAADAEKERARLALESLRKLEGARINQTDRQNETNVERYRRSLNRTPEQINEAIDDIKIDGLNSLNDGLAEAIMGTKSLGDVFKSVANQIVADLLRIALQRAVIGPLADAIFGGGSGGGGGGLFGAIFGGIFGRASGGYVAPGQMYRVNENASPGKVEGFMSRDGGQIIPLGQMNAMRTGASSAPAVVQVHIMEGQMFEPRVQAISGEVSVQVIRASAPGIIDAAATHTMAQAGRPRL